jgi:hypothetical protein
LIVRKRRKQMLKKRRQMEYEDRNQCTGEGEREREGRERGDWRLCLQDRTIADQVRRAERE